MFWGLLGNFVIVFCPCQWQNKKMTLDRYVEGFWLLVYSNGYHTLGGWEK